MLLIAAMVVGDEAIDGRARAFTAEGSAPLCVIIGVYFAPPSLLDYMDGVPALRAFAGIGEGDSQQPAR